MSGLILREELGIFGVWGLQPITYDAVQNPVVFVLVAAMFFDLFLWWLVHWYRRKYGDLAKKYELARRKNK